LIEILDPKDPLDGTSVHTGHMSFKEMQARVGGVVECVHIVEAGKLIQVVCNENGHMLRLPYNPAAAERFKGILNMGPGPVGVYMVLSGKDRLK
jgi:hypothetical protein